MSKKLGHFVLLLSALASVSTASASMAVVVEKQGQHYAVARGAGDPKEVVIARARKKYHNLFGGGHIKLLRYFRRDGVLAIEQVVKRNGQKEFCYGFVPSKHGLHAKNQAIKEANRSCHGKHIKKVKLLKIFDIQ